MQITLWEHCASAAFSLNAFWGLLVTPVGHAVSPGVCSPSPVLLSPTWEHKWQAAFKQAMLHLWNLSSRWFLLSCYCLISRGWHGWGHARCCPWSAAVCSSEISWALGVELSQGSCPWGGWRWAAAAGLCWGEELGQWGRAGELWCHKITSTPGRAQSLGSSPQNQARVLSPGNYLRSVGEKFWAGVTWASWAELLESVWTVRQKRRAWL